MTLAAVLFDMDGTLLDSERLWGRALHDLATHHGGTLSATARAAMVGRDGDDTMRLFYQDLGITEPDPAADDAFLTVRMTELFTTELRWRPGAAELLAAVRAAGVPSALVTSTERRLVEVALDHLLGRDNFDVVVCGDEVTSPKPHPEPYRTAAAHLRVPIHHCVAIEDSPIGAASAVTAGARVLCVPGEAPLVGVEGIHQVESLLAVDLPYLVGLLPAPSPAPQDSAGRRTA